MGINNSAPDYQEPAVDLESGRFTPPWMQYLSLLLGSPAAIVAVPLTASPMQYKVPQLGYLAISGAGVSQVRITRARMSVDTGAVKGPVPCALGDVLTITYAGTPVLNFVPL